MSERPPVLIQMNLVRQAAIDWLWQPYLARGKLAILDGDPGAGKSFFAADLAARLSRGGAWPDGAAAARPANTLFLNAEDGLEDTLLPRLDAAGADLGRVASLGGLSAAEPAGAVIQFPYDLDRLRRAVVECRAELVVIDPMMAFFPPEVSTNNDQSIRMALTPLAGLAAETGTALLLVRHLNKGGGGKALYRGSGSIGIIGAIRTALFLARDPNDPERRLFAMSKSNIGPLAATLAYRLAPDDVGRLRVEWLGACDATADDLCGGEGRCARGSPADDWLRSALASGPRKAAELVAEGEAAGFPSRTLERAKKRLGVVSEQVRRGDRSEWYWADPSATPPKTPAETGAEAPAEVATAPAAPPAEAKPPRKTLRQMYEERFGPTEERKPPPFPRLSFLDERL